MDTSEALPADDLHSDGPTEQELLDAVLRNSPIMEEAGIPPPEEEVLDEDPVELEEDEDPETSDEIDNEEYEEEDNDEVVEAADEDDTSTQEAEAYTMDDLDLDAEVMVKIDGEEKAVSFGDLIKGYTTDASLSSKGRELGEARKALEEERLERLGQLDQIAEAGAQLIMGNEQQLAKQYHDLEAQIKKARDEGDTFELGELKDKREIAQQKYWQARRQRESLMETVEKQKIEAAEEQWKQQIQHFQSSIGDMIPDYNETVAGEIREFALSEGIPQAVLDTVTDPTIVKFVDDYRRLKQGVSKGKAKRKAAPVKKVPAKKARPANVKAQEKSANLRKKVLSGNATEREQDDFLRNFASQSLSKI